MTARSVGAGPGLLLDDQVALDGEDATALAQIEQFDQLRVDVQLVAVLAEAPGDAETEALAAVGQAESRIEAGANETSSAAGAAFPCP